MGVSNPQTTSKLRVSGKIKWYHEKNRGALKTISFDCVKQTEANEQQNGNGLYDEEEKDLDKESCGSVEKENKLEKRKQKKDLSKIENKYLNKKKALRECADPEIVQDLVENQKEKITKLLNSIDFNGKN